MTLTQYKAMTHLKEINSIVIKKAIKAQMWLSRIEVTTSKDVSDNYKKLHSTKRSKLT